MKVQQAKDKARDLEYDTLQLNNEKLRQELIAKQRQHDELAAQFNGQQGHIERLNSRVHEEVLMTRRLMNMLEKALEFRRCE